MLETRARLPGHALPGFQAHRGGLPGLCAGLGPRGVPLGLPKPSMGLPRVKEPGLPAGTARGGVDLGSGQPGAFSELLRLVLILPVNRDFTIVTGWMHAAPSASVMQGGMQRSVHST